LDIFLDGFISSSCHQHSLKFLLLNITRLLKCVLNCEQKFSYFDSDYSTSELTVTGLVRVYCSYCISLSRMN
jgi:hypothetical protein